MVELQEVPGPVPQTPEQKEAVAKRVKLESAVQLFVLDKINKSFDWWYGTKDILTNINLDIIGGKSFEPHLKEGRLYVGSEWKPVKGKK